MNIKEGQGKIFLFNLIAILFFTILFALQNNWEFMIYVAVVIFFALIIIKSNKIVNYPNYVLWLLSIWAFFHMAGGGLYFFGIRLYDIVFINIIGAPYYILRYDQVIHAYGFFCATLAMYYLIKPMLKKHDRWISLGIVIAMAGLGLGALNEIIEFLVTIMASSTGVGGYVNTSLDLVFNLIGAIFAVIFVKNKK